MKLTVIIPVFNNKSTILEAIELIRKLNLQKQIIVVDNCSTDGTIEILRSITGRDLEIVYQSVNYGWGQSVITGMNLARGEYIYVHNPRLEYDPACVYEMLEAAERENLDAVFGSRLMSRGLGAMIVTRLANVFYKKNFTDICGNKFYRTSALRGINPKTKGAGFDFEILSKFCKYGLKIKEIPVVHYRRRQIKRALFIRTDRFGEFILNLPAVKAVKQKFPSAHICMLVNPTVKEIVEGNPSVDEIIVYNPDKTRGLLKNLKLTGGLKKRKFDLAVILNPQKKFHIITFLAGIPVRLGYNRKFGFLLTHKIEDKKSLGQKHEIEYNLDLVRAIGIGTEDKSLFINIPEADVRFADSLLTEHGIQKLDLLVALHPWTSDPVKQWPLENFSQIGQKILRELQCRVVIIGGKLEAEQSKKFCEGSKDFINLTGRMSLRQSGALLKRCNLLVSNDSGPVHLASAVGTPVIAIFRNDLPGKNSVRWGPRSSGSIVIEKSRLSDITVDEVLEKIKEVVKK